MSIQHDIHLGPPRDGGSARGCHGAHLLKVLQGDVVVPDRFKLVREVVFPVDFRCGPFGKLALAGRMPWNVRVVLSLIRMPHDMLCRGVFEECGAQALQVPRILGLVVYDLAVPVRGLLEFGGHGDTVIGGAVEIGSVSD